QRWSYRLDLVGDGRRGRPARSLRRPRWPRRLGLAPMLHRLCRRVAAEGRVAVQDGVELFDQPAKSRLSARKDFECLRPLGEIMAFKQSPSDNSLVALEQRQRHQEVLCGDRLVTFGKPLEKDERPVWPLIQK